MQIEMSIKGLMVDPITNMPIVILRDRDGQKALPIWMGIFEANAIALQMENISTPRPMTHDLLRNVIQDLKARRCRRSSAETVHGRRTGLNSTACLHQNRSILVVVAKQRQVDRIGYGPVAGIVGMRVIAAVI